MSRRDWYHATALAVRDMLVERDGRDASALRAQRREETLLSIAGVSHRALAGEQSLQPRHHRRLPRIPRGERSRPATAVRGGAGRRRLATAAWAGWPPAFWIRWRRWRCPATPMASTTSSGFSARGSRRLPGRTARQLAARDLAVAGCAARGGLRRPGVRANRASRRTATASTDRCGWTGGSWSGSRADLPISGYGGRTVNFVRLFSADRLGRIRHADLQRRRLMPRRSSRRSVSEDHLKVLYPSDAGAGRARAAAAAGIFFRRLRGPRHRARLSCGRGEDVHDFPSRVAIQLNDTHPALAVAELMRLFVDRARPVVGNRLGDHPRDGRLHQSYFDAGGAGALAGRLARTRGATPPADHLRNQSALSGRGRASMAEDDPDRARRVSIIEEGHDRAGPDGASGDHRQPFDQRRFQAALRAGQDPAGAGVLPALARIASTTRPMA